MLNEEELCHESGGGVADSSNTRTPDILRELMAQANISFDGDHPCDIQVNDPTVYRRILTQVRWGLVNLIWTACGMLNKWTSFLPVFCVTIWMKN